MRTANAPLLLVVSAASVADAGTARPALRRAAERRWPGVEIRLTGLGAPATVRGRARDRARSRGLRTLAGPVGGRMLARVIDRACPDFVVSTDRTAAEAVDWLRRRRALAVPTAECADPLDDTALDSALHRLTDTTTAPGERRVRAADALFAHVDTAATPQHVGTALVFEPGPAPRAEDAADMMTAVPGVLGRIRPATTFRPARWTPVPGRTALSCVDEITADAEPGADPETVLAAEIDRFFSIPLDPGTELGRARVVTGLPDGRSAILVKLHHALGDGMTVLQALLSEIEGGEKFSWARRPVNPVGGPARTAVRAGPRRLARGLWLLALAGRAPRGPTDTTLTTPDRRHELVRLPGHRVRACARAGGVTVAEWLTTAFAQALHETTSAPGRPGTGGVPKRYRLMVPWSVRGTDNLRHAGNHTGAVPVDLPTGALALSERARRVARALRARTGAGVPEAASLMVTLLGVLPPRLHAAAARRVYRRGWFNAIGTVLPGPRRTVRRHGRVLPQAYPVLALAPGTGLAWGALTWGDEITVCVTGPVSSGVSLSTLAARLHDAALTAVTPEKAPEMAERRTP